MAEQILPKEKPLSPSRTEEMRENLVDKMARGRITKEQFISLKEVLEDKTKSGREKENIFLKSLEGTGGLEEYKAPVEARKGGSIKKQYGYAGGGKVYSQPRTTNKPKAN